MKIAYLLGSLGRGGTETLLLDLFRNADKAEFEFIGIHRKDGALKNDFYAAKQRFFKVAPKFPFDIAYFFTLRKLLRQEKITIVHAQQSIDALFAWIACLGTGIKIVQTFHGFDGLSNKKNQWMNFTAKRTDKNIFVSRFQKDYYVKKYGLSENRQAVVYNGVSFDKFDKTYDTPDFLKNTDPTKRGIQLAMVGNFVCGHEQNSVCKFLKLLKKEGVVFDFYFIGKKNEAEPWRYDACVKYCVDNDLTDCVHFIGSRQDVPAILQHIDAFVYSTDHDTFGIAVIEAIATGLPVFVNDWGVMKEITNNGEYATLYKTKNEHDLFDKFQYFIQNRNEYKEKAIWNADQIRKKFNIQNHICRLNNLYTNIAQKK
jgi:glycosyltransferase involved in cell wall biosynthesis